jgi:hypothetical protein
MLNKPKEINSLEKTTKMGIIVQLSSAMEHPKRRVPRVRVTQN